MGSSQSNMKGKLVKENDYHYYLSIDGKIIADINAHPLSSINVSKLSKQNCDEIFGVVDVEKLADDEVKNLPKGDERLQRWYGFINGFNKRDELNKDKVFTEEDMRRSYFDGYNDKEENKFFNPSKSIQQPTEIEVEIEMICPHPEDTYRCGLEYGCGDEDVFTLIKYLILTQMDV